MGFTEARRRLIQALQNGAWQSEAKNALAEKNQFLSETAVFISVHRSN